MSSSRCPIGGEPVKYEFDKKSGALFVDRILHTPMRYPANYGFVPHTLSPDGDPLDALVIARSPFVPGCVVRARPIGVLNLEDEHGGDEKLICVPVDSTFPYYSDVGERQDLPSIVLQQIEHFFTHYKDLEAEKWVRVGDWGDAADARRIVIEAINRARGAAATAARRLTALAGKEFRTRSRKGHHGDDDRIYFAHRAAEEQEAATAASDPAPLKPTASCSAHISSARVLGNGIALRGPGSELNVAVRGTDSGFVATVSRESFSYCCGFRGPVAGDCAELSHTHLSFLVVNGRKRRMSGEKAFDSWCIVHHGAWCVARLCAGGTYGPRVEGLIGYDKIIQKDTRIFSEQVGHELQLRKDDTVRSSFTAGVSDTISALAESRSALTEK